METLYASREEAVKETGHCDYCNNTGQTTICHRDYKGQPTMDMADHNGQVRKCPARLTAHCICPIGRWMRQRTDPKILYRIPDLREVISGHTNFSLSDPTLPYVDDSQVPDWQAFRRKLAANPPLKIVHVTREPGEDG